MKESYLKIVVLLLWGFLGAGALFAEEGKGQDQGKEVVGKVKATLYVGTNGEGEKFGGKAQVAAAPVVKQLSAIKRMRFKHYWKLGDDTQPVFRSYENWLSPLKPSEDILLSFELNGKVSDGGLRLDLEFWQQKRKVMKSDPVLYKGRPLYILGPQWRGGRLIIAVELVENLVK